MIVIALCIVFIKDRRHCKWLILKSVSFNRHVITGEIVGCDYSAENRVTSRLGRGLDSYQSRLKERLNRTYEDIAVSFWSSISKKQYNYKSRTSVISNIPSKFSNILFTSSFSRVVYDFSNASLFWGKFLCILIDFWSLISSKSNQAKVQINQIHNHPQ